MTLILDAELGVSKVAPGALTNTLLVSDVKPGETVGFQRMQLFAAQNTTSGTVIDFTGIPSWAKRVTVIFNGVSTNGASPLLVRIGSGSVDSSGYYSSGNSADAGIGIITSTTGMIVRAISGSYVSSLLMTLVNVGVNTWVSSHAGTLTVASCFGGGTKTLSGTLDRVRITTELGTDTFDAGSVSILVEGYA